jgi:hypothetical protein
MYNLTYQIRRGEFNEHYDFAYNLMNMMVAFKKKII